MTIDMKDDSIKNITQLEALIKTAKALGGEGIKRCDTTDDVYIWMNDILIRLRYRFLRKKDKGVIREYLSLYSGYGKSHVDHLIAQYVKEGKITRKKRTQPSFESKYTHDDIVLLAEVSEAYDHQNGRALKNVCKEMHDVYQDKRFVRLKDISVSHLYNLKKTITYRNSTDTYTKTRPVLLPIGERKKPYPEGMSGYIRVDSVHQGDKDKEKGVYHINLVDEVTQHEVVVTVEGISEEFLKDALEEALASFPFVIKNFHSDNGSEYINKTVARLLNKLNISQTKSRARRTNDNALVEGKNAAVVRRQYGRVHIPRKNAPLMNEFNRKHLNPFLNLHRFCAFPEERTDVKTGKVVRVYEEFKTPTQKLLSLPNVEKYLKPGVTVASLREEEKKMSHLEAAKEMQKAKAELFKKISRSVL
jgi:hypothetical protein